MSSWSKAGKEVRLILFECLNRPEAKNIYFNPVQCAELCNLAAGLDFCRGIDSLRIGRAFSNGGESDYSLQFNQLIIGSDATHFLHVLIDKRMDGERYTAVGCFTSEVERIKALQRLKSDNNIKLSFRQWGLEYIRSSVIGIAFQKQYGEKTIESAVAQPRKRAISTQQSTNELYAAEQNRLKTKAEIEKLREELAKIERRGKEIKELIRTKINECEGILDSPMNVDESNVVSFRHSSRHDIFLCLRHD
jgi:hypothetical protein